MVDTNDTAKKLLQEHDEVVIIYLDKDTDGGGEASLGVLSKFMKISKLAAVFEEILLNIQRTRNGQQYRPSVKVKTTNQTDPQICNCAEEYQSDTPAIG